MHGLSHFNPLHYLRKLATTNASRLLFEILSWQTAVIIMVSKIISGDEGSHPTVNYVNNMISLKLDCYINGVQRIDRVLPNIRFYYERIIGSTQLKGNTRIWVELCRVVRSDIRLFVYTYPTYKLQQTSFESIVSKWDFILF